MKALSIKQPWAWLICAGHKDIENRTWKIGRNSRHGPYSTRDVDNFSIKLPERVYVHAGKKFDEEALELLTERFPETNMSLLNPAARNVLGAIIGEIDILDCVTESESPWFTGPYGFVLSNPVLYSTPIPYRGQLGFFEVKL